MYPTNQNPQNTATKIQEALSKGTSGIIILPNNPSADAVAAACSLYLGLSKMGKNTTIACSTPIQADFVGADKIQNNISTGGDNLVISFPFQEGALDKVDYGFQGNFFNIIITPRPNQPKLEPNKVKFSYTGGSLDFIITIDAPNLNSIGQLYTENQSEFAGKNIINIDRHLVNDMYGTVNYVVKTASSTSELIMRVLQSLRVELDKDIATNLYAGLTVATNNFTSYSVNADTFEIASTLLKAGAMKRAPLRPGAPGQGIPMQGQPMMPRIPMQMQGMDSEMGGMPMHQPQQQPPRRPQPQPQQQQHRPGQFNFPQQQPRPPQQGHQQNRPQQLPPAPMEETMKPIEDIEVQPGTPEAPQHTPQDWLKPKIFKGGGLV